ncbi:diaminopimelate epimerase [Luteimonas sp. WGS1318]|uniref:diaminopimelate epimerase n=1 Tax=Luteimonas sp. WGS1318 TaxID=3366815 RepID=UPI00372D6AE8
MSPSRPPMRFTKMHGAGNDFVVLDLRHGAPAPDAALCRALADRHTGVGCDQILTIEPPQSAGAVARYGIWNADGSASQQCGNGARCVAAWLVRDGVKDAVFALDSPAGRHEVTRDGDAFRIEMGVPEFAPARIPMGGVDAAQPLYTLAVDGIGPLAFGAASMGNPHAVVEVDDIDAADVDRIGRALQASPWFPESVNVGFAQVVADDRVRLRVFERGVGETLACGSGACAAVAVLVRRGLTARSVAVALPGGTLRIDWPSDTATLAMTGPAAFVFEGELSI